MLPPMADILNLICWAVIGVFRSRASLEAEILTLRQQLNVLRRKSPKRLAFSNVDRLIFVSLYRIAPRVLDALTIVEPETVSRWHRAGFLYLLSDWVNLPSSRLAALRFSESGAFLTSGHDRQAARPQTRLGFFRTVARAASSRARV